PGRALVAQQHCQYHSAGPAWYPPDDGGDGLTHHLTGSPCWSWLSWFIGVSTRRWCQPSVEEPEYSAHLRSSRAHRIWSVRACSRGGHGMANTLDSPDVPVRLRRPPCGAGCGALRTVHTTARGAP